MRLTIQHPTEKNVIAVCGFDHQAMGWFLDIRSRGHLLLDYSNLVCDDETSLTGILNILVSRGFFTAAAIPQAYDTLQVLDVEEIDNEEIRRVAAILEKLKAAAAD